MEGNDGFSGVEAPSKYKELEDLFGDWPPGSKQKEER